MRGGFYIKLAATGIGKNRKLYFPYILTCICMVMMFYIVVFLAKSSEIRNLPGGDSLQTMLGLGVFVIDGRAFCAHLFPHHAEDADSHLSLEACGDAAQ